MWPSNSPQAIGRDLETAQRLSEETNSQIQKALASQTMKHYDSMVISRCQTVAAKYGVHQACPRVCHFQANWSVATALGFVTSKPVGRLQLP